MQSMFERTDEIRSYDMHCHLPTLTSNQSIQSIGANVAMQFIRHSERQSLVSRVSQPG